MRDIFEGFENQNLTGCVNLGNSPRGPLTAPATPVPREQSKGTKEATRRVLGTILEDDSE
ncbi:hypothetical protein HZA38_01235 [Candidatus Peregrinibacteria bacterium]|nr:hypothetical protein [Candidatus Peregrinibacteria bacterium]